MLINFKTLLLNVLLFLSFFQINFQLLSQEIDFTNVTIEKINSSINTEYSEFSPILSPDGKYFYFATNRNGGKFDEDKEENSHDIWFAQIDEKGNFINLGNIDTVTCLLNNGINTKYNEYLGSMSKDGKSVYFTGCKRPDGFGSCDIYKAVINQDGSWTKPVNLGLKVNSLRWDAHPTLTSDKSRIYFTSNRPGPNGDENIDIWYSDYDFENEIFFQAKNMKSINTKGREMAAYVSDDGKTLFFSSDGYADSTGGLDIYVTYFDAAIKKWSNPKNLGAPVNSTYDELHIIFVNNKKEFYFSSTRKEIETETENYNIFKGFFKKSN